MSADATAAIAALNRRFLLDYPGEAAMKIETLPPEDVAEMFAGHPVHVIVPVWERLAPDMIEVVLAHLPEDLQRALLAELEPARCTALLSRLGEGLRDRYLALLSPQVRQELQSLLRYPRDTAGLLMDPRIVTFRGDMTVQDAEARLRALKPRAQRELFLIDDAGHLSGRVEIQELAVADPDKTLQSLAHRVTAAVQDLAPREEVVETFERHKLFELPVIDFEGRFIGLIHHTGLVAALQQETSLDIQTMVGVSKDERALSTVPFAVVKRLPWLQINLLTAFLAASVVGLFESTIAQFTALAVLLPVVAGQSGNAGAQALAVTMRGLALREISLRHWIKVVMKEVNVGLLNGVAIALTTAVGVYVWSRSFGLVLVISIAMLLSMVAAGLSGALIPITLSRLGQDPAQSSSIILTTVTDVVGFLSFLGIATLLSAML